MAPAGARSRPPDRGRATDRPGCGVLTLSVPEPTGTVSAPESITDTLGREFVPLELPDAGVQRYLRRFNIGAVYIIAGSGGFPCVIGSGTDQLAAEMLEAADTGRRIVDCAGLF